MTENGNEAAPSSLEAKPDRVLSGFGFAFGLLAIGFGLVSFLAGAPRVGWALLIGGFLLLPLIGRALGDIHAIFRRPMIPGLTAVAVGLLLFIINPFARTSSPATSAEGDHVIQSGTAVNAAGTRGSRPSVDIVAQNDPMRPAQDALNRGEVTKAVTTFFSSAVPQERRASPEGQQLRAAIQKAHEPGLRQRLRAYWDALAPELAVLRPNLTRNAFVNQLVATRNFYAHGLDVSSEVLEHADLWDGTEFLKAMSHLVLLQAIGAEVTGVGQRMLDERFVRFAIRA